MLRRTSWSQYREADRGPRAGSPRGVVDATGLTLASRNDAAANDRFRIRLRLYPVATAPGTDFIPEPRHYLEVRCFAIKRMRMLTSRLSF